MPQSMTFGSRAFNSATFHTYFKAKNDKRSKFNRHFNFQRTESRVAISHFSPEEILKAFCDNILQNDMNTVIVVNNPYLLGRHQALEGYIFQLAGSLGLPVLSWNAQHSVADRVSTRNALLISNLSSGHDI